METYEEKYKDLVKRLNKAREEKGVYTFNSVLDAVAPELKIEESERICRKLIAFLKQCKAVYGDGFKQFGLDIDDAIAWLEKQYKKDEEILLLKDKTESLESARIAMQECHRLELEKLKKQGEQKPYGQRNECLDCQFNYAGECKGSCQMKRGEQKSFARYKVGDTIYYDSFGRLVNFVIANIVEDGTDNPMYEDKDGNSIFQKDIVEQKSAEWSEEDKRNINELLYLVEADYLSSEEPHDRLINFLESIKDRVQPQSKQEWSEQDERIKNNLLSELFNLSVRKLIKKETEKKYASWLKSLRPQKQWRPSDEQIFALQGTLPVIKGCGTYQQSLLESLYEDLKKLREEDIYENHYT